MTTLELYHEATRRGLHFEPRDGGKLAVIPGDRCPPDFAEVLRAPKRELLNLIEAQEHRLPADCAPWLHVARQVLAGEFDAADRSTLESLTIGLRATAYPLCRRALEWVQAHASK